MTNVGHASLRGQIMDLKQSYIRQLFEYDPLTGILVWKCRPVWHFSSEKICKAWNTRLSGKRAGKEHTVQDRYTYRRVFIDGKYYREHRVIWVYMNGDGNIPNQIDHINQDATDNIWDNLRNGDNGVNAKNQKLNSRNTSGYSGVSWCNRKKKWRCASKCNGKYKHIGYFVSKQDAVDAIRDFYDTNGFTKNHGA